VIKAAIFAPQVREFPSNLGWNQLGILIVGIKKFAGASYQGIVLGALTVPIK